MYGFRHCFASNALGIGIPLTDVAEWMGHKSIEETYRTYRHLMPGSITKQPGSWTRVHGKRPDSTASEEQQVPRVLVVHASHGR